MRVPDNAVQDDAQPAYKRIRTLLDLGMFEQAQQLLDRLPPGEIESAQARFLHGLVCMKLGQLREAVATLERLVAQVPDNGYSYHYLGLGEGRGNVRGATACFRRALELPGKP
jgi:tetratricopeptide (TPR) repeat protein